MSNLFDSPPHPTGLPPGITPEVADATVTEESVSPEEQAQYDQIVEKAATFIYKNPEKVVQSMNQKDLPVHQAVGRTLANVMKMVESSAKSAKVKLSPEAMFGAGEEVAGMLMELGTKAKVLPLDENSPEYEQVGAMAMMEAAKAFGEDMLASPQAKQYSEEAQDQWAHGVAQEVDDGTADPQYMQQVQQLRQQADPVAAGVKRALGGNRG